MHRNQHSGIHALPSTVNTSFPHSTLLPKMHTLEANVPDWIQKWGIGLGLMGEQGAESIHKSLNGIESSLGAPSQRSP